jgi:hypothetical protein
MPECYLCGAYIKPGDGYRRTVRTGTSSRFFFFGRRPGVSSGSSYGLRTVCAQCAATRGINVNWSRVGRGVIVIIGLSIISTGLRNEQNVGGVILGAIVALLPVGLWRVLRRVPQLWKKPSRQAATAPAAPPPAALPATPTVRWPSARPIAAVRTPVAVQDPSVALARRPDETVEEWAERFHASGNPHADAVKPYLGAIPPSVGEPILDWTARVSRQVKEWTELDPRSAASCIRVGESLEDWVYRIGPSLANPEARFQRIIDALTVAARARPPEFGETAAAWGLRIEPLVSHTKRV